MRTTQWAWIALAILCGGSGMSRAGAEALQGTLKVDPVALVRDGKELDGKDELSAVHEGYRYLFASDANREAFRKAPGAFAAQLGGACARMGPLSGLGNPRIHAVHDGKLYFFASTGCRKGFLARPADLLDADEPVPAGDAEARTRGKALIEKAVEAVGGAKALDGASSYQHEARGTVKEGGKDYRHVQRLYIRFPDQVRTETSWDDSLWGLVSTPADAFFAEPNGARTMWPSQRGEFDKSARRHPLIVLRARNRPDFSAVALGRREFDGAAVERVATAFAGATSEFDVDPSTGRILAQRYRGRGPGATFGTIERRYSDFAPVGGLTLPRTITTLFEGKPFDALPPTLAVLSVNAPLAADLFRRPEPAPPAQP